MTVVTINANGEACAYETAVMNPNNCPTGNLFALLLLLLATMRLLSQVQEWGADI